MLRETEKAGFGKILVIWRECAHLQQIESKYCDATSEMFTMVRNTKQSPEFCSLSHLTGIWMNSEV